MILADKIIELRKKNGWSQEDLAERLEVSRQSISKWESAQSVPDMNRIIKMSEVFGVSTDFLLKDELEMKDDSESNEIIDLSKYEDTDKCELRRVTMEEAASFLEAKEQSSRLISIGVMLCILSPIILIILSAMAEFRKVSISPTMAEGGGLIVLFLLVGTAVGLFIMSYFKMHPFEYMETELIDTEYGVSGMAKAKKERFSGAYIKMMVTGIVMCVVSVLPIFITMLLVGDEKIGGNELYYIYATGVLLLLVALGVFLIVRASIIQGSYQMLLEEGDYTRKNKIENKKNDKITTGFWMLVTAGYLAISFATNAWNSSWMIWPVAGVLYGVVILIAGTLRDKD